MSESISSRKCPPTQDHKLLVHSRSQPKLYRIDLSLLVLEVFLSCRNEYAQPVLNLVLVSTFFRSVFAPPTVFFEMHSIFARMLQNVVEFFDSGVRIHIIER
jgi:hypothetical protein